MKNKKVILSSILSLVLCLSLIVGGTFALFTSESKTNIAITSGKVEVVATIENLAVHSPTAIAEDGKIVDDTNAASNGVFANGGTAEIVGSTLTLDKMTPGDKVTFDIRVKNNSTVAIKYRTLLLVGANDGLFEGLNVTVDGTAFTMTQQSAWKSMEVGAADIIIPVEVVLPSTAGNEYQEKSAELNFTVSAVQGNTVTEESEDGDLYLYNAIDLVAFSNSVNAGNTYAGKTVTLADNIDMAGVAYTPAGNVEHHPSQSFAGTFDGNDKVISNLTTSDDLAVNATAGLFGSITGTATVKNVTIKNANISSTHYAGGIVGYITEAGATVSGCKVIDSVIASRPELLSDGSYDNGDKVGGIVGLAQTGVIVDGNTVEGTTVSAYRDFGGIVGAAQGTVTNNTVTNLTIHQNLVNGYKSEVPTTVGYVVGRNDENNAVVDNNTVNGVVTDTTTVPIHDANGLKWFSASVNAGDDYAGKTVLLMNDIDLANGAWTSINNFAGTFDGQNYTVFNMTANFFGTVSGTVKNLNVEKVTVINATKNGANGFIGTVAAGGLVDNCKVSGVDIKWTAEVNAKDTTDGFGGVIGGVQAGATVQNCEFSDITVTSNGKTKRTGAVFSSITGTVKGCVFTNVNFTVGDTDTLEGWVTSHGGGLACDVNGGAVVEDCIINNMQVNVYEAAGQLGGVFGKAHISGQTAPITLKDITVNGLTMNVGNASESMKNVAGFIGQPDSRKNDVRVAIDNCHINGLDMTLVSSKQGESAAAGFISGLCGGVDVTNCSVSGKINGTNTPANIGGFIGDAGGYGSIEQNFTNCSTNVDITVKDSIAGGFIAVDGTLKNGSAILNFTNCKANGTATVVAGGTGTAAEFCGKTIE